MSGKIDRKKIFIGALLAGVFSFAYFGLASVSSISYENPESIADVGEGTEDVLPEPVFRVVHLPAPEPFKAIYMSQCVSGTPSFRDQLVRLIDDTELNSVVIDVKDYTGKIAFVTNSPVLRDSVSDECRASDMKEFIGRLHDLGIYVVGRVTVFQDPFYTKKRPDLAVKKASDSNTAWKDYKGLSFIDVGARDFWDYILAISREAYDLGFDELNYDYIRYPSDGNMKDIAFPHTGARFKDKVLEEFFAYLSGELRSKDGFETGEGPVLSADLFGMTTTNTDDLNIGQILERALPYFDYVMPMVYPSHYPKGFNGWAQPATIPYDIVKFSMDSAVKRARALANSVNSTTTPRVTSASDELIKKVSARQLRPWLQDFDLGATYTSEMVRAQIQATYDSGLTSWALWDAGNTYTRSALLEAGDGSE